MAASVKPVAMPLTSRRNIMRTSLLLLLIGMLVFVGSANAQAVAVDYTKAHATWTEDTLAGVPTSYTLKCGTTAGGPYTKTKNYPVAPPLTTTSGIVPISDLVTTSGTYFCIVTASSLIGESAPSTEVTFQAGRVPSVPQGVAITPN
jgi:hypothetical protein